MTALLAAGATNEAPEKVKALPAAARSLNELDPAAGRRAINQAIPLLQYTSLESKRSFDAHASRQNCTSCHSQYVPMAAIASARKRQVPVDTDAEHELIKIVSQGELKNPEADWEALFHPDAVPTKGYALFGYAAQDLPADEFADSAVHHLAIIQGPDGRWHNNLPRPPIQSSDIGATALAIQALQHYALPGRQTEFAERVNRARKWLWTVKADNNEARIYQILGLGWRVNQLRKLVRWPRHSLQSSKRMAAGHNFRD